MSIESEKLLERKLNNSIRLAGGLSVKLLSSHLTGLPDRVCLLPGGVLFFAEVKTTKQKPKKIQKHIHKRIQSLGFKVFIIDKSEDIKQIMRDYENREI